MQARSGAAGAKVLLLLALIAGVVSVVAVARAVSSGSAVDELEDPCSTVMNAPPGAADPLASAGLGGRSVSAELLQEFVPVNVTCVGRVTASESYVRGVFIELADRAGGGTAAVYVALHPADEAQIDVWQRYLRETFPVQLAFDRRGDGSLLALMTEHPRSAAAQAAYGKSEPATSLWQAVGRLVAE